MAVKLIFLDAEGLVETEVFFPVNTCRVRTHSGLKEVQNIVAGTDYYVFPEFGDHQRLVDQVEII